LRFSVPVQLSRFVFGIANFPGYRHPIDISSNSAFPAFSRYASNASIPHILHVSGVPLFPRIAGIPEFPF
jgi:hypothetical protein